MDVWPIRTDRAESRSRVLVMLMPRLMTVLSDRDRRLQLPACRKNLFQFTHLLHPYQSMVSLQKNTDTHLSFVCVRIYWDRLLAYARDLPSSLQAATASSTG